MEINDVPSCATVPMNNIQGYMNRWKGSLNQIRFWKGLMYIWMVTSEFILEFWFNLLIIIQ